MVGYFTVGRVVPAIMEGCEVFQMRLDVCFVEVLEKWMDFAFEEDFRWILRLSNGLAMEVSQILVLSYIHEKLAILSVLVMVFVRG